MTDVVADHRPVLLLNPGLVVLAVRPGTGELDAPLGAVLGERFVDEYAVVVVNVLLSSDSVLLNGKRKCPFG